MGRCWAGGIRCCRRSPVRQGAEIGRQLLDFGGRFQVQGRRAQGVLCLQGNPSWRRANSRPDPALAVTTGGNQANQGDRGSQGSEGNGGRARKRARTGRRDGRDGTAGKDATERKGGFARRAGRETTCTDSLPRSLALVGHDRVRRMVRTLDVWLCRASRTGASATRKRAPRGATIGARFPKSNRKPRPGTRCLCRA